MQTLTTSTPMATITPAMIDAALDAMSFGYRVATIRELRDGKCEPALVGGKVMFITTLGRTRSV